MQYWKLKTIKNEPGEIWKPIPGHENTYQISNFGRVKKVLENEYECHIKIHAQYADPKGYPGFLLSTNGTKKRFLTHRIVALAFIPNPENKPMVNHKNGIRTDATVLNLEYVTCSENHLHSYKELKRKAAFVGKTGKSHPASKAIICITTNQPFNSITEAANALKLNKTKIANVCKGKHKQHHGLVFKYLEIE